MLELEKYDQLTMTGYVCLHTTWRSRFNPRARRSFTKGLTALPL